MNIFLTSPDPRVCAQALDDKRVVKMALESAQLLATSLRINGEGSVSYKATHTHHPCSKWAARSRGNFLWLVEHGLELCEEYEFRYDRRREHKSKQAIIECYDLRKAIPDGLLVLTGPQAFNSSGFDSGDVFLDYRLCMIHKWRYLDGFKTAGSRKPVWTYRGAPPFKRELWDVNLNSPT